VSAAENTYRLQDKGQLPNAWKIAAGVSAVGLVLAGIGYGQAPDRFGYSFLFGFFATLTVLFGAMFHVIAQHVTQGHWSVSTRRIAEILLTGAPVMAVFGIVLLAGGASGKFPMYREWLQAAEHAEHGEGHAAAQEEAHHEAPAAEAHEGHSAYPAAPHHTPQMDRLHHRTLGKKVAFLNKVSWVVRGVVYILAWLGIYWFYYSNSRKQDETKDKQLTNKMRSKSPAFAVLFGLTLTFAAFDWVMSLQPGWYSTIFGVVIFGGSAVTIFALLVLFSSALYEGGHVGDAINVEHVHDHAKLMFGFMCFWTYVSFSQWMLIWYAGIPEESVFFQARWTGGWEVVSKLLPLCHFAAPFVIFISREVKRRLYAIRLVAGWLLFWHVVDIFWYVMPTSTGHTPHFMVTAADVGCLLLVGGAFFAVVLRNFGQMPLVPVGDPRFMRSVHHHQTH